MGKILALLLVERLDKIQHIGFDLVMPVPLHFLRKFSRGFNQAEEIGKKLAEFFKIPLLNNVLLKIKETPTQVELDGDRRKENLRIVGVDLGIKTLATLSDGVVFENPKFYSKALKRIKKLSRRLAKKKKGSKYIR